jgi:hypothetical protein
MNCQNESRGSDLMVIRDRESRKLVNARKDLK